MNSKDLEGYFELVTYVPEYACSFCGITTPILGETIEEVATELYKLEWREVSSDQYQVIDLGCPKCVAKPDKDR